MDFFAGLGSARLKFVCHGFQLVQVLNGLVHWQLGFGPSAAFKIFVDEVIVFHYVEQRSIEVILYPLDFSLNLFHEVSHFSVPTGQFFISSLWLPGWCSV